jgi:hypothetical protein
MRRLLLALLLAAGPGLAAAANIAVRDPFALSANPRTGAVFMVLENRGGDDRIVAARSEAAATVELHTHVMEDGIAKMRALENGVPLPAGATVALERGGLHVMLIGLTAPLEPGDRVALTLVLESGAEIAVEAPVLSPKDAPAPMTHGTGGAHTTSP